VQHVGAQTTDQQVAPAAGSQGVVARPPSRTLLAVLPAVLRVSLPASPNRNSGVLTYTVAPPMTLLCTLMVSSPA
jgi:hypothetical protein